MTATIQVRTNEKTKKSAQQILASLGLDLSTAINMYLMQIIIQKGVPFEVRTENGYTAKQEKEMLQEIAWAKKYGKRFRSAKELHRDILSK